MKTKVIFTIGHSTLSFREFLLRLQSFSINCLVDVRTVPRSHQNPQFNTEQLKNDLERSHIKYIHLPGLGGWKKAKPDSINIGWRNAAFRGYADYMQTQDFINNLKILISLTKEYTTVFMCAEAVPWRCHRSLISDALTVRHIQVQHIMEANKSQPHHLTPFSAVQGQSITYPSAQKFLFD